MLEGTKHEKAVLVLLAYIIGLTSGFIGFGINNLYQDSVKYTEITDSNMVEEEYEKESPVLGTTNQASYIPEAEASSPDSDIVVYENGQLTAHTDEGHMVLSVHVDQLGDTIPESLAIQGHHTAPPVYLSSPEGRYVYFCEQHLGANDCTNLLFDKEAISIQYVQVNNSKFVTPVSQAASAYWAVNGLNIGQFTSESATTPWKLIPKTE